MHPSVRPRELQLRRQPRVVLKRRLVLGLAVGGLVLAQPLSVGNCKAQAPDGGEAPKAGAFQRDLITRYRFTERYGTDVGFNTDGAVGQYRVGIWTTRGHGGDQTGLDARTRAQDPKEVTQNLVYVERAAEVSSLGQVKSLVRRYEKVEIRTPAGPVKTGAEAIEGLTIWYRPQIEETPQVISLSENRRLREQDYVFVSTQVLVPNFAGILPGTAVRIGDTWQLSRNGVRGLISGEKVLEGGLGATLTDVMPDPNSATGLLAVIDVEGRIKVREGFLTNAMGVKAKIKFAFTPKRPPRSAVAVTKDDATLDARGAIVRLDLALEGTSKSEADRAAKPREIHRVFVVERQLTNTGQVLEIPREAPKMDEKNSWLTFVDPQKQFSFRHPQDLHHPRDYGNPSNEGPTQVELVHQRPGGGGTDFITLNILPGVVQDPMEIKKQFLDELKKKGGGVLEGASDWLPEIQWPGMKAYRCEAAMVNRGPVRGVNRLHIDEYIVQIRKKGSIVARGITSQDPPTQFRNDVEEILRTFKWGPPDE